MRPGPATLVVLVALAAGSAEASDEGKRKAQAKQLLLDGNALFDQGRLEAALALFQAAYDAYPSPKIFYNMASAQAAIGNDVAAAELYARFLDEAGLDPGAEQHALASTKLARLDTKLSKVVLTGGEGASITIDDSTVESPAEIRLRPGQHRIAATREGHQPFERVFATAAGDTMTVVLHLVPVPRAAPPPAAAPPAIAQTAIEPESDPIWGTWWFWTAIGVVVAGATAGVILGTTGSDDFVRTGELGVVSTSDLEPL